MTMKDDQNTTNVKCWQKYVEYHLLLFFFFIKAPLYCELLFESESELKSESVELELRMSRSRQFKIPTPESGVGVGDLKSRFWSQELESSFSQKSTPESDLV